MSNEQKSEIIKSLAYGMTAEEIAGNEGVTTAEVEEISVKCIEEIRDTEKYLREVRGDDQND